MALYCLTGKPLAAVRDFGHPCGHRGLVALGWDMCWPYFNAGLLLLDLKVRTCRFEGGAVVRTFLALVRGRILGGGGWEAQQALLHLEVGPTPGCIPLLVHCWLCSACARLPASCVPCWRSTDQHCSTMTRTC